MDPMEHRFERGNALGRFECFSHHLTEAFTESIRLTGRNLLFT